MSILPNASSSFVGDGRRGRLALIAGPPSDLSRAVETRLARDGLQVRTLAGTRSGMRQAVDRLGQELGAPSILVTIPAGHDAAPFGDMSRDRWQRLLVAHLGLTVDACAAVVPAMVAAGRGTVVTTCSWLALAGVPGEAYLAAASGSILAFSKSFALEVTTKGVRVNCITVGRLGHGVEPTEVADTVAFLWRDGDFFVGQALRATGGAI